MTNTIDAVPGYTSSSELSKLITTKQKVSRKYTLGVPWTKGGGGMRNAFRPKLKLQRNIATKVCSPLSMTRFELFMISFAKNVFNLEHYLPQMN